LLFNFASKYAIRHVQENQKRLKLNGTHQLLAYDDDINIFGRKKDILQKKTKALLDAGKEVGHEVNPEKRFMAALAVTRDVSGASTRWAKEMRI
jgi:hypothetical protein